MHFEEFSRCICQLRLELKMRKKESSFFIFHKYDSLGTECALLLRPSRRSALDHVVCVDFSRRVMYDSSQTNQIMLSTHALRLCFGGGKETRIMPEVG